MGHHIVVGVAPPIATLLMVMIGVDALLIINYIVLMVIMLHHAPILFLSLKETRLIRHIWLKLSMQIPMLLILHQIGMWTL